MNNIGVLYGFELKKILMRKIVWITSLICFIAAAISVLSELIGSYYVDGEKAGSQYEAFQIDRKYQKSLDGRAIDQTLLEEMSRAYGMISKSDEAYSETAKYQKYARPYSAIFNFTRDAAYMTVSETMQWNPDESELYDRRKAAAEAAWEEEGLSQGEKNFWAEKETKLDIPITYKDTEGYYVLFRSINTMGIVVVLAVAICLAGVFADEHTRRTDQLILCSTHGKGGAYWAKILAGISFSAGFSLTVTVFTFLLAFGVYGTQGFHAAFQLIYPMYSYPIHAGEAVIIIYGMMLVTAIIVGVFVMALSEMLRNNIAALAVTTGIVILGMVGAVPSRYRVLGQIWDWFPSSYLTPGKIFGVRLLPFFGKYLTSWQAVPLLYLTAGIIIVAAEKFVYQRYQVTGR